MTEKAIILTPENIIKTWQESNITITANQITPLNFISTKPNVFIIKNNANTTVYVSKDNNVDNAKFEVSIPPYGLKIFQKPYSLTSIYFHADNDAAIRVESYEGKFDASDIIQTSGDIAQVNVTNLPILPAGDNNIGNVDIVSLPALPAGTNNIGDVDVLTLPSLPAGSNLIGKVDENGYTWIKVTAGGSGDQTVKGTPGTVAAMILDAAGPTVYLKDGTNQAWKTGEYILYYPIAFTTSIKVNFSAAGSVWVLYK